MKAFNLILLLFSLTVFFSCENYPDYEIEHTPIYPLSGEWRVRITDMSADTIVGHTMYVLGTYNTADNDKDSMWIRITATVPAKIGTLRGKIPCNVPDLNFSATNTSDISVATKSSFTITEGKITLNAIDMPSKVKADKISFKYTTSKAPGKTFLFEGYRRTLWPEDESYLTF